ncbi:DUF4376 domain-containing protein [Stutzerimonas nitrititolerans]|uniref:DUF4376 domain-containing protein n=1 Tax=Stutzerimonas nitrititolerans TaxID=2482751 RepID=UPI0028A7679F|nr:DUF4376 domain-containing protein [Stutzerimonas nitrititolerans]
MDHKFYKSSGGQVFAYETEHERAEFGAADLVSMTVGEVKAHLAPPAINYVEAIAARRWQAEVAGISLSGMQIDTGRDSQALITGATVQAMLEPSYVLSWKTVNGFVDLTAEQIIRVASAVRAHVQACFDREADLLNKLAIGTFDESMLDKGWPGRLVSAPA